MRPSTEPGPTPGTQLASAGELSPVLARLATITASKLEAWLMCPLKFRFQYLDKLDPAFTPSALAFGTSVHAAIQWFHESRIAGKAPMVDEVVRIFRADWQATLMGRVRFQARESAEGLTDLGASLLETYVGANPPKPLAVEAEFQVPLVNPRTGEVLPLPLTGRIDVIEPEDVVVDVKTSRTAIGELDARQRLQLTAYHYAYTHQHGREPKLRLDVILKQKTPRFAQVTTERAGRDHERLFHLARVILRGVEVGVLPPNVGWQCVSCPFREPCERWTDEARRFA